MAKTIQPKIIEINQTSNIRYCPLCDGSGSGSGYGSGYGEGDGLFHEKFSIDLTLQLLQDCSNGRSVRVHDFLAVFRGRVSDFAAWIQFVMLNAKRFEERLGLTGRFEFSNARLRYVGGLK